MSRYRSGGYGGLDRPDPDEIVEAREHDNKEGLLAMPWRTLVGILTTLFCLLVCVLFVPFIAALVNNPTATSTQLASLWHEAITTVQWIIFPAVVALPLLWVGVKLWHGLNARAVYPRQSRYPAIVNARGRVTMLDDQQPRYEHLHSLQAGALPALPAPEVVEADPEDQTPKLPAVAFRDVSAQLGSGQILIGVRPDGTPRIGTWDEYKSILVVGDSSSGKTNTIAQLIAQSRAQLVICDPHAHKRDSLKNKISALAPWFYPGTGVAVQHPEILHQVHLVRAELERRVNGGRADQDVLLVVEEWNRLQRDAQIAEELAIICEILGQEGRGFGIYGLFAAQSMIGFAKVRRAFISSIVHRVDEVEARMLVPTQFAKLAPDLPKGATLVKDADGKTELLQQALITPQDIAEVARLAPPARPPMVWQAPLAPPELPPLPYKPGRVRLDTGLIEPAAATVSVPSSAAVALAEPASPMPPPVDIREYLAAQQKQQKQQKPLFTPEEWREVLRLYFVEGVPRSRILPELRKLGISKDGNAYHDLCRLLDEAQAAAGAEAEESAAEDEAVLVSEEEAHVGGD